MPGLLLLHVFMGRLHGLGSIAHVLEHFSVGVGVFQSLSLELNGGQRAVNLGELLLVPLLPLQSLQSRYRRESGWAGGGWIDCHRNRSSNSSMIQ